MAPTYVLFAVFCALSVAWGKSTGATEGGIMVPDHGSGSSIEYGDETGYGCFNLCGKPSISANQSICYCDAVCTIYNDCCDDYEVYCNNPDVENEINSSYDGSSDYESEYETAPQAAAQWQKCCIRCQDRYHKTDAEWKMDEDHWVRNQWAFTETCDQIGDDGTINTNACAEAMCAAYARPHYNLSAALYKKDIAQCPGHVKHDYTIAANGWELLTDSKCVFYNGAEEKVEVQDWNWKHHQPATEACCVSCQDRYNQTGEDLLIKHVTKTATCNTDESYIQCAEVACKRDYPILDSQYTQDIAYCPSQKLGVTAGKMNGDVCEWDNGETIDLAAEIHQF